MPPKIDLAARLAEMTEKKKVPARRKVKTTANRVTISIPEERPAKRPREEGPETADHEEPVTGVEIPREDVPAVEVLNRVWTPTLFNAEGRSIMDTDSVHADPRLGLGLLPALGLPNDLSLVPGTLEGNIYHCSSLLVQTGQSMLKLHDRVLELDGVAMKQKTRAEAALAKVGIAESRAEELRLENEWLKQQLANQRERSEQEAAEHLKALEEARQKGHDAGFAEAGEAYAEDIFDLVSKGKEDGKQEGFELGYKHCCKVFGVASVDPKCKVPPLPAPSVRIDDDEDSEEDSEDLIRKNQTGASSSGVASPAP